MEWLSQNWTWILLFAAAIWFFTRRGHAGGMGCCGGMAHEAPRETDKALAGTTPPKEAGAEEMKTARTAGPAASR